MIFHRRHLLIEKRGAALLLSLVMIAILSVIVLEVAVEVRIAAERVSNDFSSLQAEYSARSGVTFALALLQRDLVQDRLEVEELTGEVMSASQLNALRVDSLDEEWARGIRDFDLGKESTINLYISDLPGRINLNSLVTLRGRLLEEERATLGASPEDDPQSEEEENEPDQNPSPTPTDQTPQEEEFLPVEGTDYAYNLRIQEALIRLFESIEVLSESEFTPEELVANITDWIDPDNEPYGGMGAEDEYYLSLPTPYRSKNWFMASFDELQLVKGFTPKMVYGTRELPGLIEYLGVVRGIKRRLNINTAPPEVIETWLPDLPPGVGAEVVQARAMAPFEDREDLQNRVPGLGNYNRYKFNSRIFLIVCEGIYRNSKVTIVTTVSRQLEEGPVDGLGGFSGGGFGFGGGGFGGGNDSDQERITFRTLTYKMIS